MDRELRAQGVEYQKSIRKRLATRLQPSAWIIERRGRDVAGLAAKIIQNISTDMVAARKKFPRGRSWVASLLW